MKIAPAPLETHNLAKLIPAPTLAEFLALRDDIKINGQKLPIILFEGKILDGRTRYKACRELGLDPITAQFAGDSPTATVISLNLNRRHLTPSQRACVAVAAEPEFAIEAKKRQIKHEKPLVANLPQVKSRDRAAAVTGASGRYVSEAKIIKKASPAEFVEILNGTKTISEVMRAAKRTKRIENIKQSCSSPLMPDGKYAVILADPPWRYDHQATENRAIENNYQTITTEDISKIEVPAAPDAVLYLWATAPKLVDALQVIAAWGFRYKTCAVWDKIKIGQGYWFRNQHELLLVSTRGNVPPPVESARVSSVIRESRTEHSKKPKIVYEIIEKAFPDLPKIELFARTKRQGWAVYGNQVGG